MSVKIHVPDLLRKENLPVVASVSGGKDSTALMLALREADIPFRAVFADTGWEAPETYAYLDVLRERLGPIDVVKPKRDMVESIMHRAGFPARMQRWCTRELKIKPLRQYHDALGGETVSALGIRADESESRAKMPAWSDDDDWGGWVWRPLLTWTIEDVLSIHHRHGIPLNPLYISGHSRVGCYPCIFSRKEEIRLLPDWRVDQIESLERDVMRLREERNEAEPGRYAPGHPAFFQTKVSGTVMSIRDIVAWSRTSRGGRQLDLLADVPQGGCVRWGMCEAPSVSDAGEGEGKS